MNGWMIKNVRRAASLTAAVAVVVAPEFRPEPVRSGGYASSAELIADCRASGKTGWDLVQLAQDRVHAQFLVRSYRQPWRTPESAFVARAGYCSQYNLVLRRVLRGLGFQAQTVFAARVRADDAPWWRSAHVWVRVRYDGRTRWCCARHATAPGEVSFVPGSEVLHFRTRTYCNTTAVLILLSGAAQWKSIMLRRPLPTWMEAPF